MDIQSVIAQIKGYLFDIATFVLVLMLAVTAIKLLGVNVPIRSVGHVELAYLCGALWLLRK
jgi:hypothetical protein